MSMEREKKKGRSTLVASRRGNRNRLSLSSSPRVIPPLKRAEPMSQAHTPKTLEKILIDTKISHAYICPLIIIKSP